MEYLESLRTIHRICTRFEEQWGTSSAPTIEQLLEENKGVDDTKLLCALIQAELEIRCEAGESPRIEEYQARFPGMTAVIEDAFRADEPDEISDQHSPDSVEAGRQTHDQAMDATPTVVRTGLMSSSVPFRLGPYEILDEIARGGMGVVYRARHLMLRRIVALKVILAGRLASETELVRFRQETRAVAALDHPGVVPIYDVGESHGYHYFAMPMVEGANLADLILERPLPPVDAAKLVAAIADTIDFAHRRGIIHRDLKPRNILLDRQGQPRVTDFGLAKLAFSEESSSDIHMSLSGPTGTGQILGTPSYMAPEQAQGQAEQITLLADVYSLGALMYALMTGRPPFQAATPIETLRQVIEREPVPPRKLNPGIPIDLETIVLKCLSKSPAQRYSSAAALGADLQRFLDGLPITARRVPFWTHIVRWTIRQPVVAGLLSIVVITILMGATIATRFYLRARENATEADKNFAYAQDAVRQYLAAVGSSPELKVQGLETLRKTLISTARDFYARLAENQRSNPRSRMDLAQTLKELGKIDSDLNDQASALQHYQAMDAVWEELLREDPENPEYQRWRSNSQMLIGVMYRNRGNIQEATRFLESAYEMRSQLVAAHPQDRMYRIEWALMMVNLWDHASRLDQKEAVERWLNEATKLCEDLMSEPAADVEIEQTFVAPLTAVGAAYLNRGDASKSLKFFAAARDLAQKVVQAIPEAPDRQLELARCAVNMAQVLPAVHRENDARAMFAEASEILEKLAREHPLVGEYRYGLAVNSLNLGVVEFNLEKWDNAEAAFLKASQLLDQLHLQEPDNLTYRLDRAQNWTNLGNTAFMREKYDDAERFYSDSIDEHRKLIEQNPLNIAMQSSLEATRGNLAQVYTRSGRNHQAIATMQDILDAQVELAAKQPAEVSALRRIINSRINLIGMLNEEKRHDEAEAMAQAAIANSDTFIALHPELAEGRMQKSLSQYMLGTTWLESERLDQASEILREAQQNRESLLSTMDPNQQPDEVGIQRVELAKILRRRGEVSQNHNEIDMAFDFYSQAATILQSELDRRTDSGASSDSIITLLGTCLCNKARILHLRSQDDSALQECELGLKVVQGEDAADLHAIRARIWAYQGQAEKALEELPVAGTPDERTSWRLADEAATHALVAKLFSESDSTKSQSHRDQANELLELVRTRRKETYELIQGTPDFISN